MVIESPIFSMPRLVYLVSSLEALKVRGIPEYGVHGEVWHQGSGVPHVLNVWFYHVHFEPWGFLMDLQPYSK